MNFHELRTYKGLAEPVLQFSALHFCSSKRGEKKKG
jgi:hypothetical protein